MLFQVLRRTTGILSILCYVVIFGILCALLPILTGWIPVYVKSPSMEPAIKTGSLVYYHRVQSFDELHADDVIAFRTTSDGPIITHRISQLDQENGTLRTKGDANDSEDPNTLNLSNVVGIVGNLHLPWVGFGIRFVQQPLVIALMAFLIIANLVLEKLHHNRVLRQSAQLDRMQK